MLYNIGCYIDVCYIAKGRCYIAKVVYTMLYSTSQPSRCPSLSLSRSHYPSLILAHSPSLTKSLFSRSHSLSLPFTSSHSLLLPICIQVLGSHSQWPCEGTRTASATQLQVPATAALSTPFAISLSHTTPLALPT